MRTKKDIILFKSALRHYDYLRGVIDGISWCGTSIDLLHEWINDSAKDEFIWKDMSIIRWENDKEHNDYYIDVNYKEMALSFNVIDNKIIVEPWLEIYSEFGECIECNSPERLKEIINEYELQNGTVDRTKGYIYEHSKEGYRYVSKSGREYDLLIGNDSKGSCSDIVFIFDYNGSEGGSYVSHCWGGYDHITDLEEYCNRVVDDYEQSHNLTPRYDERDYGNN